jgi:hypothetical protein
MNSFKITNIRAREKGIDLSEYRNVFLTTTIKLMGILEQKESR